VSMVSTRIEIDFRHRHSAHCENGVTAGLFSHHGREISEAMVFGIGSGLFFAYVPILKMGSLPLVTYRIMPGQLFKKASKRLGVRVTSRRFRSQLIAERALDELLEQGEPVACQTGAYWLPYFPPGMRFHFNAHNIVVYGRDGDDYLISDPVLDEPVRCSTSDLLRARFAKGPMAPKGRIYYPTSVPEAVDLSPAIVAGIRETCRGMLKVPMPWAGVRGIRFLARRLARWPERMGEQMAAHYLGTVIRMQEEIGTGGAGFRFIFAAFLQEAAKVLVEPDFRLVSESMTATGDHWREFARLAARNCKGRAAADESYERLAAILLECADQEESIYRRLQEIIVRHG